MSGINFAANGQPLLDAKATSLLLDCTMAQVARLAIPFHLVGTKRFYQADEIEKFQLTQMKEEK